MSARQANVAGSNWRAMTVDDLASVDVIAARVHPSYPEDHAVFAERLRLHATGCRVLMTGGEIAGYVISHPWHLGEPPALNALLGSACTRSQPAVALAGRGQRLDAVLDEAGVCGDGSRELRQQARELWRGCASDATSAQLSSSPSMRE